jgi:hypothetical protein
VDGVIANWVGACTVAIFRRKLCVAILLLVVGYAYNREAGKFAG